MWHLHITVSQAQGLCQACLVSDRHLKCSMMPHGRRLQQHCLVASSLGWSLMPLEAMCRGGEKEGSFEMLEMETYPELPQEAGAALKTKFSWTANGKAFSKGTSLYYKPPCLLRYFAALWHCTAGA